MQEFIQIYEKNKTEIDRFLIQTVRNNAEFLSTDESKVKQFFNIFNSLELIYITDKDYIQISPNMSNLRHSKRAIGRNRKYLLRDIHEQDAPNSEQMIQVTDPYVSSASGESCVTLIVSCEAAYYFLDFNLSSLLSRFGLVEKHPTFNFVSKAFYFTIGLSMMFFSLMLIGYAFYGYFLQLVSNSSYSLESVFQPIIALTLGLAIFDLAKTLLEREVVYKGYADKKDEDRLLSKFLIAIIVALSIEALLVVFKTAIHDPTQMVYALYLILGISFIIVSLAFYNWVSAKK